MLESPHFDLPNNEDNRELFKSNIDWEKEEAILNKQIKKMKVEKLLKRVKALFHIK